MEFLYLLEKIRNPFLDGFFSFVTLLGDETVFLALAICVLWCVSKREGYYILSAGLFGLVVNQVMKLACAVPRPWVRDPNFTIVESAREAARGYSFPSGHSQNATGTFGAVAVFAKPKWIKITASALAGLIIFSRLYLGVHTPADVLFSLAFGIFLLTALRPLFRSDERFHCAMPFILAAGVLLSVLMALWFSTRPSEGLDYENLLSAKETAATLLGCIIGLSGVYALDRFFIKFDTKAPWYAQVLKLTLGFALVLLIKSGLKAPLGLIFENGLVARSIRYFLVVAFAGGVWPLTFRYFAKIKISSLDRLGERVAARLKK